MEEVLGILREEFRVAMMLSGQPEQQQVGAQR